MVLDLFVTRIWNFVPNWVVDKLLLEHTLELGLPLVLDLAVHLVNCFGWMS